MQSHLRGVYSDKNTSDNEISSEELRINELHQIFKKIITAVHRFLYRAVGVASTDIDFESWLNRTQIFNVNDITEYFEFINDQYLDSPIF